MGLLLLLAALGYLQAAHDPCNFADGRHMHCHKPAGLSVTPTVSRDLAEYMRAEYGVLQWERRHDGAALRLTSRELGDLIRGTDPEPPRVVDSLQELGGASCMVHGVGCR